jgi:serine protease Do
MDCIKTAQALLVVLSIGAAWPAIAKQAPPEAINLRHTVIVDVVKKTKDAVVNISATKTELQRISRFGDDPFFAPWDGGQVVRVPADSLGSGFIIHRDGYVVTNHHVIDRARKVNVELADGRKLPAEILSSDAEADLALLKIRSEKPLPALALGDSSDLMIGEPVIAVGNPLGFSHSVSTGIISAIHRDLKDGEGKVLFTDLIQTDTAINPGNSGGPLLNAYGQVIGINTAIRGDAQNIGFAIQVNRLRDLVPELMNPLHINKLEVPVKLLERRRLTPPATVECDVLLDTGKQQIPIITAINGQKPRDIIDAYAALLRLRGADGVFAVELADGSAQKFTLKRAPQPATVVEARKRLGLTLEQVTPALAERQGLNSEDGLLVTEVLRNSTAARSGLRPGDIIVQVARYTVSTLDDFGALLERFPKTGQVRLRIIRGDRTGYLTLVLE